jgi:hypothetical protein
VIDEHRHLKRLRGNYVPVPNASGHDKAAYMKIPNPVNESFVFGVRAGRVIAVTAHDNHLRNAIAQGEFANRR